MRSKLNDYSKGSKLMNIKVKYGKEEFKFNLYKELIIDENTLNRELKEQPSLYGFLTLLHKKLIRIKEDKETEVNKIYADVYIDMKNNRNQLTGKPNADDLCKQTAIADTDYNNAKKVLSKATEQANIIGSCVRSFEQRKDVIQTLSANLRKES